MVIVKYGSAALVLLLALFWPIPAWSCPFCSPAASDLYTVISSSTAVCKVARVGPSKFKLLRVLRGNAQVGRVVLARDPGGELKADSVIVLATVANPNQPFWSEPARVLNPHEFAFFNSLIEAKSDDRRRDIAAGHFTSASKLVSDAAYNVLSAASVDEVQARTQLVGVKALIERVLDSNVPEDRKGLMYIMLVPYLNAQDKGWLRAALLKPRPKPQAMYLPGLMAAYAEVDGPSAIEEMTQVYLTAQTSVSDAFNPISGFRFIGTDSKSEITREAARKVLRSELGNPERGPFVIDALREWKDYSVAPLVEKMAYDHATTPWVAAAVVGYFKSFHTPAAGKALQRLRREFPDMVGR